MNTRFLSALTIALALAGSSGMVQHAAARSVVTDIPSCATQNAAFTTSVQQGISIFSPKRLMVYGTCFAQGASIRIWDYTANVLLTNGVVFLPSDSQERFNYYVSNALCKHLLRVIVLDVAHNRTAAGNEKVYGPCQTPPPVFEQ